ncbi:MurR/RpiR family transcriptional regulator [Rhizobium tubonense]|uniref:Transcriptional regulator, RpiR family protein n=1 Tax=Rhizobium tubonense TaxID=484088 RepID=A0A2W4EJX4_9HYPH|nr:MurR/RpiR family transcriptional regulator [Rhizobium tubonense]PZM11270.1 transcriptional regulator, RpiR family protein [Rhizobium tubonense]
MEITSNLIETIRAEIETFNRAERRVAEAILSDLAGATRLSIRELASRAEVSEPTIVRFSRRLGCDGFSSLKLKLAQDYALGRLYFDTSPEGSEPSDVVEQVYRSANRALASARDQFVMETYEQAALLINNASRVFCFGVGGSSANLAAEAEDRLFRLDVPVSSTADPYKQRMMAAISGPGDVFLMFSTTGKPQSLIDSAEVARKLKADVIAVTRPQTPLGTLANVHLSLSIADDEVYYNLPNPVRYAQLLVLDCLAMMIAASRSDVAARKLRRIRMALVSLHGPTQAQPIGD